MSLPDALRALNSELCVVVDDNTVTLARRVDGDLKPLSDRQAQLLYAPLKYLNKQNDEKPVLPVWMAMQNRPMVRPVFKAGQQVGPDEFNLFGDFAIEPDKTLTPKTSRLALDRARPFLRHLFRIVCNANRHLFRYAMKWLAFAVQHPGANPEVWLVLVSKTQGAGKSVLRALLERIFGEKHCGSISGDPLPLYQGFNGYSRRWLVAFVEDQGDARAGNASKLRGCITDSKRRIEEKNIPVVYIPNCLHVIVTTTSATPVILGVGTRRHVIFRMREDRIGQLEYFKDIHDSLAAGGAAQMLRLLQGIDLTGWHPRQMPPHTSELIEMQQDTEQDIVVRYFQDSLEAGGLLNADMGRIMVSSGSFGREVAIADLHSGFAAWARAMGERPVSPHRISHTLRDLIGKKEFYREKIVVKQYGTPDTLRRGWALPSIEEFRLRLEAHFDPAKRRDLEGRVKKLRRQEERLKPLEPGDFASHQATLAAAALLAVWPRKLGAKALDYEALLEKSKRADKLKSVLDVIHIMARTRYGRDLDIPEMNKVLRAFAGASANDTSFLTHPDPEHSGLVLANGGAPSDLVTIELPIGVALKRDGSRWDVVLNKAFAEE